MIARPELTVDESKYLSMLVCRELYRRTLGLDLSADLAKSFAGDLAAAELGIVVFGERFGDDALEALAFRISAAAGGPSMEDIPEGGTR